MQRLWPHPAASPHPPKTLPNNPPRPRPAVRVGITGHRLNRLLERGTDLTALRERLHAALAAIQHSASVLAAEYGAVYTGEPILRLITPLAEGTDQIVADEGLALGYRLDVPMPAHADQYVANFQAPPPSFPGPDPRTAFAPLLARAETVQVLDASPHAALDGEAYDIIGRTVLRHSDILLAVWDGEPGRGAGGTAAVVAQARAWNVPTLLIDPRNPDHWVVLGTVPGYEHPDVAAILRSVLAPPADADGKGPIDRGLLQYLRTRASTGIGGLFVTIVRLVAFDRPPLPRLIILGQRSLRRARRDWDAIWTAPPPVEAAIVDPIRAALTEYIVWADGLADRFGTMHRDASIIPLVFGPIAVAFAIFAHANTSQAHSWFEFATLGIALLVYLLITLGKYHDRWIDYRSLAEELRRLAFLWPVGRPAPALQFGGELMGEAPQFAWVGWYVRSVAREVGLFPCVLTSERMDALREMLVERFVRPQIAYHERTAHRFEIVTHRLHSATNAAFFAALVVVFIDAVAHPAPSPTQQAIEFAAAFLPALAAATHGLNGQGDFSNISKRSDRMVRRLEPFTTDRATAGATATIEALGDLGESAADTMRDDVLNWRVFARLKGPSLG